VQHITKWIDWNRVFPWNREIKVGDYVKCVKFDDLTEKQLTFVKSKDYFTVTAITDSKGQPWKEGIKFLEIGYSIPLMMSRFKRFVPEKFDINKYQRKVLFIAFDIKLKTYGEKDVNNILRGCDSTVKLFPELFKEKIPEKYGIYAKFAGYDDINRYQNEYYVDDICLTEFDFVFFGFMASATNMATLLVNYVTRREIPHMKYETYDYFHNKAFQFDLLETLGYPYIPSLMTTKLTPKILKTVSQDFGYPVIVKDVYKDRGEGVWKINSEKQLNVFFKGGYMDDETEEEKKRREEQRKKEEEERKKREEEDRKKREEEEKKQKESGVVKKPRYGYGDEAYGSSYTAPGFRYGRGTYDYRKWTAANNSLVLIQRYIPNDGEWRVITIKNQIALIARKDAMHDVNKQTIDERKSRPGNLPTDVKDMIVDVSKHLFSDIVGFDIIQDLNTKEYFIIETNASPHFSMFSVVTNVSVPEKIVDYIISTFKNK
jgi:glutathione synthase/RimK-type ligase-like ATP-grasp enzyme